MDHRILVACDGSEYTERAAALVGSLAWAPGTHIRLATALPVSETAAARAMGLNAGLLAAFEKEGIETTSAMLGELARSFERPGWTVDTAVVRGRASDAIAAAAGDWGATLLVVGSRGQGALSAMLMGSTSAELVDMAPCPVLVARTTSLVPVLLAADDSPDARRAEELAVTLPGVAESSVRVVSVAEAESPWEPSRPTPWFDQQARLIHATYIEEKRAHHEKIASAAVHRLATAGIEAAWEVRAGDVAHEVIQASREHETALVVIGSRGVTGLARFLGSTARNVLVHAPASVLVVRATSDAAQ